MSYKERIDRVIDFIGKHLDEELELDELDDVLMPLTARRNLATFVLQVPVHLVPEGGMVAISLSKLLPKNFTSMF